MKNKNIYIFVIILSIGITGLLVKTKNQESQIEVQQEVKANEAIQKEALIEIKEIIESKQQEIEIKEIIKEKFERVDADKYEEGFSALRVRSDFTDEYNMMKEEINKLGGIITSNGGVRDLEASQGEGRSSTSLHYLGRAIDLYTMTGMLYKKSRYILTRDGGTDEEPYWKIYCRTSNEEIPIQKIDAYFWGSGNDPFVTSIEDRFICITDIMEKYGWNRIASNEGWKDEYMDVEWWHFQREDKLIDGETTFKDELSKIYNDEMIDNSVSRENQEKVWSKANQKFK